MSGKERFSVTIAPGPRRGEILIPSSKSAVHRLLICAALAERESVIALDGLSNDILATAECLRGLGAGVEIGDSSIRVSPIRGAAADALLPCGESGSTLRFLLPVAGALGASGCFEMEGRLSERPMRVYEDLLRARGMSIRREGRRLSFSGQLESGVFPLPGDVSSQYFSGLLMALPRLEGDSRIIAEGPLESAGYIRMTEDALALAGVRSVREEPPAWNVPGGQVFSLPGEVRAEGDWSNAAFFLCMGAMSQQGVTVGGLGLPSSQGDSAVLSVLERFGAVVTSDPASGRVTVRRGTLRPIVIDAAPIPDLIPVLSVLSCGAVGDTVIEHAARLRLKESDRLKTTAKLIRDLGGDVEELTDGLIIHGGGSLRGGRADASGDHRIAMSAAAAAGLCADAVTVDGAECVSKSYPAFWADLRRLEQ